MSELSGLRLLLVEDESHVAMLIEDMLADMGCDVVASPARVSEALRMIEALDIDAAVLDVNVAGEKVFPKSTTSGVRGSAKRRPRNLLASCEGLLFPTLADIRPTSGMCRFR
jgi:DNA-binding NarL/FixJ family response regulator